MTASGAARAISIGARPLSEREKDIYYHRALGASELVDNVYDGAIEEEEDVL